MKKIIKCLMLFVVISISVYIAYAGVPDEDKDGIPDPKDKCLDSASHIIDRFGCNCVQKTGCSDEWCCPADKVCGRYKFRAICMEDSDSDGIGDLADNCRIVYNQGQEDADRDGRGDYCDGDNDNDRVPDESDNCPNTPPNWAVDANGCASVNCAPTSIIGDANGDDKITPVDALLVNNIILGTESMPENKCCIDIDYDDSITAQDSKLVLDYSLGVPAGNAGKKCSEIAMECSDSDGGIKYNIVGKSYGVGGGEKFSYTDECATETTLREYYCASTKEPTAVAYECPNGCQDGACIAEHKSFAITLINGYNWIGLPVSPTTSYTAQTMGDEINSQSGDCDSVQRWDGSGWETYLIKKQVGTNFDVDLSKGYSVYCNKNSVWEISGAEITQPVPINLYAGNNFISIPYGGPYTVETMLADINSQEGDCNEIKIISGSEPIPASGNMGIEKDKAYMVYCNKASIWTPKVTEGEYFTVSVANEDFIIFVTDSQTIQDAKDNYYGKNELFVIGDLAEGDGGFNQPWSWHLNPDSVRMAENAMEVCDGLPSDVENDLDYWLNTVKIFCPYDSAIKGCPSCELITCLDSDGGKDYYKEGYATTDDGYTQHADSCSYDVDKDIYLLHETYCEDNSIKTEEYQCPSGCENGVCIEYIDCQKMYGSGFSCYTYEEWKSAGAPEPVYEVAPGCDTKLNGFGYCTPTTAISQLYCPPTSIPVGYKETFYMGSYKTDKGELFCTLFNSGDNGHMKIIHVTEAGKGIYFDAERAASDANFNNYASVRELCMALAPLDTNDGGGGIEWNAESITSIIELWSGAGDIVDCKREIDYPMAYCDDNSVIGDANEDKGITPGDALLISNIILETEPMPENMCCVDVNNDGSVDVQDSQLVFNYYLDKGEKGNAGKRCDEAATAQNYQYSPDDGVLTINYQHSTHTIEIAFEKPMEEAGIIDSTSNIISQKWSEDRTKLTLVVEGDPNMQGTTQIKTAEKPISVRIDQRQIEEIKEQLSPVRYSWVFAVTFIIIIISFAALELSRKKHESSLAKERYLQEELQLKTYISTNLRRGYTSQQIRNGLLKDGWNKDIVDNSFQGLKK